MTAPQTVNRPMTLREWALLLLLATLWGGAFFLVAVSIRELPPLTLNAIRILLGGLVLLGLLHLFGGRLPLRREIVFWFVAVALINSVAPMYLHAWAQQHITGGLTAIINATTPLTTMFVAHALTAEEKLSGRRLLGAMVGLAGVVLIIGVDAAASVGVALAAQFAALLATFFFAFGTVFGRRFSAHGVPPLAATAGVMMASGLIFTVLALVIDRPWTLPTPGAAALSAAVAAGFLSTALAQFIFFRLLASAGANNVSLVAVLSPVSALLLGWLILSERIETHHLAGMAVIACGMAIVDGRPLRLLRRWLDGPVR